MEISVAARLWVLLLLSMRNGIRSYGAGENVTRPDVVNVGALFGFSSIVGKVAKVAIQAAVEDVNSDPSVLGGTKLRMTMQDTNYSGFLGIVEALLFMEKDTVAIIGPQNSVTAHVLSHVANELQVPLLSFSATDPTLSALQFPYFIRTSQNDLYQMSAIAEIVEHFGWREVIAIYVDDDHGRNGITALGDKLAERRLKISYKAPMALEAMRDNITELLVNLALTESRIIVLHTYAGQGPMIIEVARFLGMMGNGYVWIATNWLSTILDTDLSLDSGSTENFEGLLTLRLYTPDTELKRKFVSRWRNLTSTFSPGSKFGLSTYGLYAYDSVWILARAIGAFLDQGGVISFSNDPKLTGIDQGSLHLDAMSIFDGGKMLLDSVLQVNMTGVTGEVAFTHDRDLIHPAYEVINVIGNGFRRVGYWSNYSGLSTLPPETLYSRPPNRSSSSQQIYPVIWPGQVTQTPRGWVFPNNGRHLKIGVPKRVSFREFVSQSERSDTFRGYCIDVFASALNVLPYAVPYVLVPFGNDRENPSMDEMVRLMTAGVFDAVVGDIAITTNRTRMADFTQPYIESGLVVVAPVKRSNMDTWAFLRPFTPMMWLVTASSFITIGAVIWILEHRLNDDFRGPPKKQVVTTLWFSFSTWFFAHKENTVSGLSRVVLIVWLFVVLIINSSYTASLTSILTVQQLASPIKGIETLLSSRDPIGYQQGSFARSSYLIYELGIDESRLIPLITPDDYVNALKQGPHGGGVAALIDERAYIELFLSTRCDLSIIGQEFTKNGWGFVSTSLSGSSLISLPPNVHTFLSASEMQAFPRDSPLSVDMSIAILKLSENGDLQRIHDKWLMSSACTSQGSKLQVDQLHFESFRGLFIVCGLACLCTLSIYFMRIICQFRQHHAENSIESVSRSSRLRGFLSFVDEKEADVEARSKRRQLEMASNKSSIEDGSYRRAIEWSSNEGLGASCHGSLNPQRL